jgi:hypothetical protein
MVTRTRSFRRALVGLGLLVVTALPAPAEEGADLERSLALAQSLVANHRFQEVVDLLEPFASQVLDRESTYAVAAELGRAYYHLGRYDSSQQSLERAVALHPERVETALYLEGSSYLCGRRDQALRVFREVLHSGATDLYLAVTLPGERAFLADPEVWSLLESHAVPLELDLEEGRFRSVRLGDDRRAVERALGASPGSAISGTLIARAGPHMIWALTFAPDGALDEILVDTDRLLRYTPYRLQIDNGLDWRVTRSAATELLGPPLRSTPAEEDLDLDTWRFGGVTVTLAFGPPPSPRPLPLARGGTSLRLLRLRRGSDGDATDARVTATPNY